MKNKRNIVFSSLIALMAIPALTGCNQDDGKIHIKFWHTMGHIGQESLNRALKAFYQDYPQYKVDHSNQGDYNALHDKLNKAIPAGTMPTMAYCYPDHVADYLKSNAVVNIESYLTDPELMFNETEGLESDFVDIYWNEGKNYESKGMYSVPFAKSTEVMFYNKDFFEQHSDIISLPTTWEEMWETCKTIKEEIIDKGLGGNLEFPLGYDSDSNLFITLCEQNNIPYTTNKGITKPADHIQFNNPEAKALITDLADKVNKGYFATKNTLPNSSYTSTYFTEGKCAMSIGSTGGTSYQTSSNFEVAIAPCPVTSNDTEYGNKYILQGPDICFFKKGSDEVKKGAWLFYKYITRALYTAAFGVQSGYEPVRNSAYELDAYKAYLAGDSLQAKVSACTATFTGQFYLSDVFYGSATAREQAGFLLGAVASGDKTVDNAFAEAYQKSIKACGA